MKLDLNDYFPIRLEVFLPGFLIFIIMANQGFVAEAWVAIFLWSTINGLFLILGFRVLLEEKHILWPILIKLAIFTLSLWPFVTAIRHYSK